MLVRRAAHAAGRERFTKAAALGDAVNLSFKTLFTKVDAYLCKLLPHGPGFADEARLPELPYVNGAGIALPRYFCSQLHLPAVGPDWITWKLAQVNHYNPRSREDYLVKHDRGGGLDIRWDRDWGWATFNKDDETDLSIANELPRARALFGALLENRELSASARALLRSVPRAYSGPGATAAVRIGGRGG